jgi:hypothetical protein
MTILKEPPPESTNVWFDYGGTRTFACNRDEEYCAKCGAQLVEHYELNGMRSTKTGLPEYHRYHSCPTWVTDWRASRWAKGWACPGYGHDSHDADNSLSSRGYR